MQGLLVVISGFSGVGKGTLVKELLNRYPEDYALSISATTRKPRVGEVDGREYFFKTKKEFESLIKNDALLEHAVYNRNYYGTPRAYVQEMLDKGKNIILEIEVQGGLQIKAKYPETLLVFVVPPSAHDLLKRLRKRGTETEEEIFNRLKRGVEETEYLAKYDMVSVNDDFEICLKELHEAIAERRKNMADRIRRAEVLHQELIEITKRGE